MTPKGYGNMAAGTIHIVFIQPITEAGHHQIAYTIAWEVTPHSAQTSVRRRTSWLRQVLSGRDRSADTEASVAAGAVMLVLQGRWSGGGRVR